MICPNCGAELAEGTKFCGKCGSPVGAAPEAPQPEVQSAYVAQPGVPQQAAGPVYQQPVPQKKSKTGLIILIIVLAVVLIIGGAIAWFVHSVKKAANDYLEDIENFENELDDWEDLDIDLGLDELNDSLDEINDIDTEAFENAGSLDIDSVSDYSDDSTSSTAQDYAYSYTDVTIDGNNITIKPNGKLNGSTVFYNGKDLEGLLDYIDNTVLEPGRVINRDFFYDLLATMQVDESLYSNFEDIETNMIMCLAMANNFYNIDVRVKECNLDADNAAEYHYQVKAEGKDDTWIVNYADRTVYFNDGKTEYSSDMFKDDYLAVWWMAIDEYYDHQSY